MRAARVMRAMWPAIVSVVVGCGSEGPPAAPQGAADVATTGGVEVAARDRVLAAHRRELVELVERAQASVEIERHAAAPLLRSRVELERGASGRIEGFVATHRFSLVNPGPETVELVAWSLAANEGVSPPRVTLESVAVGGRPTQAGGTATAWEVPVKLGPAERVEVELVTRGRIPELLPQQAALQDELRAVPEIARLLPVVPRLAGHAVVGGDAKSFLLVGVVPLPGAPFGPAFVDLQVSWPADAGIEVVATGVPTARVDAAGAFPQGVSPTPEARFVALAARDIAIVGRERGHAAAIAVGGRTVAYHLPANAIPEGGGLPEVVRSTRRALEVLETRWGPLPAGALSVVALPMLDGRGVVALPGIVAVPEALQVEGPSPPAGAPQGGSRLLERLLAHHPGAREAHELAVAGAVAEQWWQGRAEPGAERLLEAGLGYEGALAVVTSASGDKARRRAIELGLRLPYQLERLGAAGDPVLSRAAPGARLAELKAGLFFEALGRHLGGPILDELARGWAGRGTPVSLVELRAEIERAAPRPAETKAFLARWLDEARGDEDVGEFRPEVLLEYLVSDGAVGSVQGLLLDELEPGGLGGKALGLLGREGELDVGAAVSLLGEVLAADADPTTKKWLEIGSQLFAPEKRKLAVGKLVEELGAELGIPPGERARLNQLGALLFEAMDTLPLDAEAPDALEPADPPGDAVQPP